MHYSLGSTYHWRLLKEAIQDRCKIMRGLKAKHSINEDKQPGCRTLRSVIMQKHAQRMKSNASRKCTGKSFKTCWKNTVYTLELTIWAIWALSNNFLEFDEKWLYRDSIDVKIPGTLKRKRVLLNKPDKWNGIVSCKTDYYRNMQEPFNITCKFKKLSSGPTLVRLTTVQCYLRTLLNRKEISEDRNTSMCL